MHLALTSAPQVCPAATADRFTLISKSACGLRPGMEDYSDFRREKSMRLKPRDLRMTRFIQLPEEMTKYGWPGNLAVSLASLCRVMPCKLRLTPSKTGSRRMLFIPFIENRMARSGRGHST